MTVIDNPSLGGDSVPASTSRPDAETGNERATGPEKKVRRRRFRLTRRRRRRRAVADRWVARARIRRCRCSARARIIFWNSSTF